MSRKNEQQCNGKQKDYHKNHTAHREIAVIEIFYDRIIRSMRQTIKEIEVNIAYGWFIGYDLTEPIPHFSTFGKNYKRRFE